MFADSQHSSSVMSVATVYSSSALSSSPEATVPRSALLVTAVSVLFLACAAPSRLPHLHLRPNTEQAVVTDISWDEAVGDATASLLTF